MRYFVITLVLLCIVFAQTSEPITQRIYRKDEQCDEEDIPLSDDCLTFDYPLPENATEIEIYYMERIMSNNIGRNNRLFSAYHGALGFVAKNAGKSYTMDFAPHSLILEHTYLPKLEHSAGDWGVLSQAAQLAGVGDTTMNWEDSGSGRIIDGINPKFKKKILLGALNKTIFDAYFKWFNHYNCTHRRFQAYSVINNAQEILSASHNCFDFCQASVFKLASLGATFTRKKKVGRDFTLMFAESLTPVNASDPEVHKDIVRFYTYIWWKKDFINKNFAHSHDVFKETANSGQKYYYYDGERYYEIKLIDPYFDFCYGSLSLPPKTRSDLSDLYCMIRDGESD